MTVVTAAASLSHEAAEAGRWSLLIAAAALVVVLPLIIYMLGLLFWAMNFFKGPPPDLRVTSIIRGAVLGADKRISTSKTVTTVWNYSVAAGLLSIVIAKWLGHGYAYGQLTSQGFQGGYAILIGGPLGAAILAKGITGSQVASGKTSKPIASAEAGDGADDGASPAGTAGATTSPQAADLVSNDQGETDLGDLQYVLFNAVALTFFFGELIANPIGLPKIPDVLIGLTSVSAVGYVGKKAVTTSAAAITKIAPTRLKAGAKLVIYGSGLMPQTKGIQPGVRFRNAATDLPATSVLAHTTAEGVVVDVTVPVGLSPGSYEVSVDADTNRATAKQALTIDPP